MLECQLIHIKGMTELGNHLFATTTKMHLGILASIDAKRGGGQSLMRNRRSRQSQSIFPQIT